VIGAGTGGYVAAIRAAQLGLKVAVVEKQKALGGTCLIWGCIPTKALLEHAHALKVAQAAREWGLTGIDGAAVSIDMPSVHARKDKIVSGLTGGIEMLFKKNKIDWIKGSAHLLRNAAGGLAVEVTLNDGGKQALSATKEIIVATGSSPRSVPGIEVDRKRIIFSDEAIHLPAVPKSIAIMGSGAVGVEFASIFKSYGSEVTVVELLPRLVPGEDEAVSAELERSFKKRGIKVMTGSKVTSAKSGAKGVDIEVQGADQKSQKLSYELLLVATGRGPVTEGLDAEKLGIKMDRGYIVVDQMFKTSVPGISAIGDVITMGGPALSARTRIVDGRHRARRAHRRPRRAADQLRPRAALHLHRAGNRQRRPDRGAAKEQGHDVRVGSFPFRALARARMAGETDGFVKIVAEKKYDEIRAACTSSARARPELVAEAVSGAADGSGPSKSLGQDHHAHPT
jgi:dihydrolipoamide dehydrogenase